MARFIDRILQPGEWVLYSTNAHWMFYLPAIGAWIVTIVFLVLSRMVGTDVLMLVCLAFAAVCRPVLDGNGLVPSLDHRDRRH